GNCDAGTGLCSNPTAPNGTACSDGNACTQTDTCQSGTCTGSNPVVCAASDPCHVAGTCDTGTGLCSNPRAPDGTACDDANPCTANDACTGGVCGGTAVPPPAEVSDSVAVTRSGSAATISWSDAPGSFNVYRGSRHGVGTWSYDHTCFAPSSTSPVTDSAPPGVGNSWYYLVSRKTACGESILGRDSTGAPVP